MGVSYFFWDSSTFMVYKLDDEIHLPEDRDWSLTCACVMLRGTEFYYANIVRIVVFCFYFFNKNIINIWNKIHLIFFSVIYFLIYGLNMPQSCIISRWDALQKRIAENHCKLFQASFHTKFRVFICQGCAPFNDLTCRKLSDFCDYTST